MLGNRHAGAHTRFAMSMRGYDPVAVDRFLDGMEGNDHQPETAKAVAAMIADVRFDLVLRGYDCTSVDSHLGVLRRSYEKVAEHFERQFLREPGTAPVHSVPIATPDDAPPPPSPPRPDPKTAPVAEAGSEPSPAPEAPLPAEPASDRPADMDSTSPDPTPAPAASSLGAFSISLPVADLAASVAFYEQLGFAVTGGDGESWSILVNGPAIIGLFHGMFDKPMLTFNPGWANDTSELVDFVDVREWRRRLVEAGVAVDGDTTGESDSGPASFMVLDPDGNPILIDQHR